MKNRTYVAGYTEVDIQNTMTTGRRGPASLKVNWLIERAEPFYREVTPERREYLRGSAAFGTSNVMQGTSHLSQAVFPCGASAFIDVDMQCDHQVGEHHQSRPSALFRMMKKSEISRISAHTARSIGRVSTALPLGVCSTTRRSRCSRAARQARRTLRRNSSQPTFCNW